MKDVGQGFNHLQKMAESLPDTNFLGLIFVCPNQVCSREAAPSEKMWLAGLDRFRTLHEETIQMLFAIQRLNPLERYAEINAIVDRVEWQPKAIFDRLKGIKLAEAKK